jgi:hypothetical protein
MMIGLPLAGERMLFVDIINTRASVWASMDRGTWTAIWSPSKSALKAVQTRGATGSPPLDQDGLERLDTQAVQGRGTVQQNGVLPDNLVQGVPHLRRLPFDHFFRALDRGDKPFVHQAVVNKRLEQFEGHFLWKTALVEPQIGTYGNDGTTRVINRLPSRF